MRDLFFVLKTFILTVAVILAMQVQLGERTIESHAQQWIESSAVVAPLNAVAKGAAKMIRDARVRIENKFRARRKTIPSGSI